MAARKTRARGAGRGVSWAAVRKLALSFPGVTEGSSYGDPAFLLDGKFFSRFNAKEQGLVVYAEEGLRDALLAGRPDVYFTTDHYRNYPYLLARLARLQRAELVALFEAAFRAKAKRKRLAEHDAKPAPRGPAGRGRARSATRARARQPEASGGPPRPRLPRRGP